MGKARKPTTAETTVQQGIGRLSWRPFSFQRLSSAALRFTKKQLQMRFEISVTVR
jgi:hypothetical protein